MDDAQEKILLAALAVVATAVTSLGLSLKAVLRAKKDERLVRAEVDHVVNNFAQYLISSMEHAKHGDWDAAIEGVERWARNHPPKRG